MAGKSKQDSSSGQAAESESDIELTDDEIELIVRVLSRHRTTLPTYLLSMQHEIELIDSIVEKLGGLS
jgi:hypothetical protein